VDALEVAVVAILGSGVRRIVGDGATCVTVHREDIDRMAAARWGRQGLHRMAENPVVVCRVWLDHRKILQQTRGVNVHLKPNSLRFLRCASRTRPHSSLIISKWLTSQIKPPCIVSKRQIPKGIPVIPL